jgi:hypothetical protein
MNEQERAEHIKALNEAFRPLQPEQRITAVIQKLQYEPGYADQFIRGYLSVFITPFFRVQTRARNLVH